MKTTRILTVSALLTAAASAASIVAGTATLSFDETAFAAVGLTGINSFDQATSNQKTSAQILSDAGTSTSWSGIPYGINSTTTLSDPSGRDLQETSFTYDPMALTGTASGQIGLGGVSRWAHAGGGSFILGDYALKFSAARETGIYSGWFLENNVSFADTLTFDIANASTNIVADGFTLSGDLYVKSDSPLALFFGFPAGDYGNFSMTASTVPEPSSLLLLASGSLILLRRRKG